MNSRNLERKRQFAQPPSARHTLGHTRSPGRPRPLRRCVSTCNSTRARSTTSTATPRRASMPL